MTGPERITGWALRLLPPERAEWGRAMRAELRAVPGGAAAWWFAAGCLRVALTRPRTVARGGWRLLAAAPVAVTLGWVLTIGHPPLRYGATGVIVVAVAASRLSGRVADRWQARLIRFGGASLAGMEGVLLLRGLTRDPAAETAPALLVLGAALTLCVAAVASITGHRSPQAVRLPATAALTALATTAAFLGPELARPPLPPGTGWAMTAVAAAACATAVITLARVRDARAAATAALCAACCTALLLATAVEAVLWFLPHWTPGTSPANVAPADRLANDRAAAEDPYLRLLATAALTALGTVWTVQTRPRPRPEPIRVRSGARP